jgi:hypothetical protein
MEERPRGKQRAEPPVSDFASNEAGQRQDVAVQESRKLYCTLSAAQGKIRFFLLKPVAFVKRWASCKTRGSTVLCSHVGGSWPRRYTLLKFSNLDFQHSVSMIWKSNFNLLT